MLQLLDKRLSTERYKTKARANRRVAHWVSLFDVFIYRIYKNIHIKTKEHECHSSLNFLLYNI